MSNFLEDFKIQRISFQMFCEARGWNIEAFSTNDKNPTQFLGRCLDGEYQMRTFIITKKGDYIGYCGPGKGTIGKDKSWEPVAYVLQKEDESNE